MNRNLIIWSGLGFFAVLLLVSPLNPFLTGFAVNEFPNNLPRYANWVLLFFLGTTLAIFLIKSKEFKSNNS